MTTSKHNKLKLALVYPEVYGVARFKEKRKEFPPFGVLYLAASAEKIATVKIFKITNAVSLDLREFSVIAYTIPSSVTYNMIKDTRFQSKYSLNKLLIVGGVHATIFPKETLQEFNADLVCMGEGEKTIIEILDNVKKKNFADICGICYFDKNGSPVITSNRKIEKDISDLPLPARHLLEEQDIIMHNRLSSTNLRMAHIMMSRGCPFSCYFCANQQRIMQYRSGKSVREELVHLIDKYGINGFAIVDDNFVVNKKKVIEICNSIKDLNLKWSALSRVDTVDKDLLQAMYDSGCIEIKFGIESGSEKILERMSKKITKEKIKTAIKATYDTGINIKVFLIHGFPGENHKTTKKTLALLDELADMIERVSLFRFVPLPGSYVYNNPKEFNLKILENGMNEDWDKYSIHHNDTHWWGHEKDFNIMTEAFNKLDTYINKKWSLTRYIKMAGDSLPEIPIERVRAYNCAKHHLVPGFQAKSISEVAHNLCGLHAARLPSPFAIAHARLDNFDTIDLRDQLYQTNQLIKLRCMRTTLHVLPLEIAPIFHQATLDIRLQKCLLVYKRLQIDTNIIDKLKKKIIELIYQEPISAENIIRTFVSQPKELKHLNQGEWKEFIKTIIKHLWEEGTICYINVSSSWDTESRLYAYTKNQYPNLNLKSIDQTQAIKLLIRYHIENFGPVSIKDIAWWSGLTLRTVDKAIEDLKNEITTCCIRGYGNVVFYILKKDLNDLRKCNIKGPEWVSLLAHEDSSLKGYFESRWRYVKEENYDRLFNQIGEARACIMANGVIIGLWYWHKINKQISYELFEDISDVLLSRLKMKIDDLEECLSKNWKGMTTMQMRLFDK